MHALNFHNQNELKSEIMILFCDITSTIWLPLLEGIVIFQIIILILIKKNIKMNIVWYFLHSY